MSCAINVLSILAACFAISGAVRAPFPRGKTAIYRYYGDVQASTNEPTPYASRFALQAKLWVKHDTSDPSLKNAYYTVFSHVETSMYNGKTPDFQRPENFTTINDTAEDILEPFLMIYDDDGNLQGVKISAREMGWSRNVKMATASMLQLDWSGIRVEEPIKSRTFISKENTIHGNCSVTYDVRAKHRNHSNSSDLVVKKFFSPTKCSGYPIHVFDRVDSGRCQADKEESLNVASKRHFEIELTEEDILMKKLVAQGSYEYLPWNARSEAHYILTNATFVLRNVMPVDAIRFPSINFLDVPMTSDLTYRKPRGHYAPGAAVDVTQGRHVADQRIAEDELKKLLNEAADYLEEDHLDVNKYDWNRGQTINRVLRTMSHMDVESLRRVYYYYKDKTTIRDITILNIFIEMIPQVGTTASSRFILKVIRHHKVDNTKAIVMLAKFPLNVRLPTPELLIEMEDLGNLDNTTHAEVRKAGILSFASLVGRTFKDHSISADTKFRLHTYLQDVFERVKNDPDDSTKILYLMALKNVQLPKICKLLAPIIRGELKISKNVAHFRLLAIWTIEKAIEGDYDYALDLLWPVMADQSLSIKLRLAAYEILMHQAMTNTDVQRIHSFMAEESNEHLYNYHYTTIQGIANSVDPCKLDLRENARKIIRSTRIPDAVPYTLSSAYSFDYKDEIYNHAEKLHTGMVVSEVTGVPEVLQFEHIVTDARKPVSNVALRVHAEGGDSLIAAFNGLALHKDNHKVLKVLEEAAKDNPTLKSLYMDLVLMHNGRVVFFYHVDRELLIDLFKVYIRVILEAIRDAIMESYSGRPAEPAKGSIAWTIQTVLYDNLYEEQITSDMGLPIVLETRIPVLASVRLNSKKEADERLNFELNGRIWRHGDYAMSVYNPFTNAWHAIRRSTATDISVPINLTVAHRERRQQATLTFPEPTNPNTLVGGLMIHAKDSVTVDEGDDQSLKRSCATCRRHEDVSLGASKKKSYQKIIDSKETGLKYTMSMFDCGDGFGPVSLGADWYQAFKSEYKNDWNSWTVRAIMATRQQIKNMIVSPRVRNCGSLLRIEPSMEHAISQIELGRSATEIPSGLSAVNGSFLVNIIPATTNTSRMWSFSTYVDPAGGWLKELKILLTRQTPGEENFKIIVGLRAGNATDSKLDTTDSQRLVCEVLIAVGRSNDDRVLLRDDNVLKIAVTSGLSKEQKKQISEDNANGACRKDIANPLYASPNNSIPKTLNCLNEKIRHATLRNYSIEIISKKLPAYARLPILYLEEFLLSHLQPNLRFRHVRSERQFVVMTVHDKSLDISVMTPARSYDLVDVKFGQPRFAGFGSIPDPVWYFPLLNTEFSPIDLIKYTENRYRICSVYPKTVLTGDERSVPFEMSENYTLISGVHSTKLYAVFGKMIGNNMAVKIYMRESVVEIVPRVDNSVRVIVDGAKFDDLSEDEVFTPDDPKIFNLKVTKNGVHTFVRERTDALLIVHGINHVALAIAGRFQGQVSGLCGHLDGTYRTEIPEFYTMLDDDKFNVTLG